MLTAYTASTSCLAAVEMSGGIPDAPVWIDMLHPTKDEENEVERILGIDVPTREDMQEIEVSSRLYSEDNTVFATATVIVNADSELPETHPVTFVLTPTTLVTLRYSGPTSFQTFLARVTRPKCGFLTAEAVLAGLLDTIVDRTADILERIAEQLDKISADALARGARHDGKAVDLRTLVTRIGTAGDLTSKASESLLSLHRAVNFFEEESELHENGGQILTRLKSINDDLDSLADHAGFLSNKANFLLEATLGLISIEQNSTIKIFSVLAVVLLPPTLIASIYGMNFRHMPELHWLLGYPFALLLMVASAGICYWLFKWKRWL